MAIFVCDPTRSCGVSSRRRRLISRPRAIEALLHPMGFTVHYDLIRVLTAATFFTNAGSDGNDNVVFVSFSRHRATPGLLDLFLRGFRILLCGVGPAKLH